MGTAALNWMKTQGWHTTYADPTQEIRVVSERLCTGTFAMGRIWHTPMTVEVQPRPVDDGHALITLPLTGSRRITLNDREHKLEAPDILVHPGQTTFELHTDSPGAHAFFEVPKILLQPWLSQAWDVRPIVGAPGYRDTIVSASMAALNSTFTADSAASASWAAGMQHLGLAMVQSSLDMSPAQYQPDLVGKARSLIRAKAHDPNYSIAKLAADLNISTTHLHRIMKSGGRSAGQLLRSQRISLARGLLREADPSAAEYQRVAEVVGFTSARVLRRSLAREDLDARLPSDFLTPSESYTQSHSPQSNRTNNDN
ncbi:AraC family transcriptional regulator [Pseudoclavibacter sp. AY1F1]|uniref:helix-turn-helix domain-containing protein n=1 Tax=Pseudoclavibacter sp. AY1F1 TaxID=2080583 RepID=UPI0015E41C7F|nr:helix-turn-helix transcriptional regulator [Pseudoclavibacter sp. AY1F1]